MILELMIIAAAIYFTGKAFKIITGWFKKEVKQGGAE